MLPIAGRPVPFAGSPLLHAAGAALLSLAAGAQTFVVDAANGPGAHFTEITAALQAVPEGAVLRVRAGDYASFTIDGRSVTVLGEPGAVVRSLVNPGHPASSTSPRTSAS
jgi:pectin methylesterase-like acyl-CoA thioesterase